MSEEIEFHGWLGKKKVPSSLSESQNFPDELFMGSNSFSIGWEFSSGTPPCTENQAILCTILKLLAKTIHDNKDQCLSGMGVCFIIKYLGSYSIMPVWKGVHATLVNIQNKRNKNKLKENAVKEKKSHGNGL